MSSGGGVSPQKVIRFSPIQIEQIDLYAADQGIKAATFIRNAVERELARLAKAELRLART